MGTEADVQGVEADPVPSVDTAPWRLIWYPRLLLLSLGLALVFVVLAGHGSSTVSGRIGGDYPAFYGAGSIVLDGDIDRLYEPARQNQAQAGLHGGEGGYLVFAYPPHVAAGYSAFSAVPYRLSYVIHTALMAACILAALQLIRPMVGVVDRHYWLAAAFALSVYPMFRAVGSGQNTSLTLLLLAITWRALDDDREVPAGVAAGLLLFRPQYAIPVMGLFFVAGHRRAAVTTAGTGVATWLLNALLLGPTWFTDWFDAVGPFVEVDAEVNASNSVSWIGFGEAALGTGPGRVVGAVLATATALVLVGMWWQRERFDLTTRMGVTVVGIVLISPHAMFYDAGLLMVTTLVAVDRNWIGWRVAGGVWLLSLTHLVAGTLGATPLALVLMAAFVASVTKAVSESSLVTAEAGRAEAEPDPTVVRA